MDNQLSEITSLQTTLNAAIDTFKASLVVQGLPEPSLLTSKPHPFDNPAYLPTPAIYETRRVALAALGQLTLLIQSPNEAVAGGWAAGLSAASIRFAAQSSISDVLAQAGDEGMAVEQLAERINVNPIKLERVMRMLISQGYYRETRDGVFANNRLSNLIKKGTPGYYIHDWYSENLTLASTKFVEYLLHPDPAFRNSHNPVHSASNLSHGTDKPHLGVDGWTTTDPDQMRRFSGSMGSWTLLANVGVIAGFPWEKLASDKDAIIDIGGNRGTLCCSLAHKYKDLPVLITQDLPSEKQITESYIKNEGLEGRVVFEAQDFFQPQKRGGKNLYILQRVLHDWSWDECTKILGRLREPLKAGGVLLIIEHIICPATISTTSAPLSFPAPDAKEHTAVAPPPFIPADFGPASRMHHDFDLSLMCMANAGEFTLAQLKNVVERAGLKINKVHPMRAWPSVVEVIAA